MPYAQQSGLEIVAGGASRFRQLADFDGDGTPDADVIARALTDADAFIDPYLQNRYSTPLATPWPEIVRIAEAEAVYLMKTWRGLDWVSAHDTAAHQAREKTLEQYQDGTKRPPDPVPAQSTAPRAAWVSSDADERPFSRCGLRKGGL